MGDQLIVAGGEGDIWGGDVTVDVTVYVWQ